MPRAHRVQLAEGERLIEVLVTALEWAAKQAHHPACRVAKRKSLTCDCFVGAARDALGKAKKWGNGEPWE